jgi:hypothetical protein
MKPRFVATAILLLASCTSALGEDVFRNPFDLHLEVDGQSYYEQHFDRVPYVHDGTVYLFKGDKFGISINKANSAAGIAYEPDPSKADIDFEFVQLRDKSGGYMMVLTIKNHTKHTVTMDALMTVPGNEGIIKTNVLAVPPGLTNIESWPHPIVQLALLSVKSS